MTTSPNIITERNKTHGDFKQNAYVSQTIKDFLRSQEGWQYLSDVQQEALDVIALKISRIMSGQSAHEDHWVDIEGYAALGRGAEPIKVTDGEWAHGPRIASTECNNLDRNRRRKNRRSKGQRSRA